MLRRRSLAKFDCRLVNTRRFGPEGFGGTYLVSDLHSQLQRLHVAQVAELDVEVGLEVSGFRGDELGQFTAQGEDILHARGGRDIDGQAFLHAFASGDVLDPKAIGDVVRDLQGCIAVDASEYRVHQRDVLHNELGVVDGHAITDIVRVFDEEEDAAGKEFGDGASDGKGKTGERSPKLSGLCGKGCRKERGHLVQNSDGLTDIVHADCAILALGANAHHKHGHLLEADIAVAIAIQRHEDLVHLIRMLRTQNFDQVVLGQDITSFADEGEPQTTCQRFRCTFGLERLQDDGVSGTGVEDLLSRDVRGHGAEGGGHLVADTTHVADQTRVDASSCQGVADFRQRVALNLGVLGLELAAEFGKDVSRSVVEVVQDLGQLLAFADLLVVLFAMVIDGDDLDERLLDHENAGHDDARLEDLGDDVDPVVLGQLWISEEADERRARAVSDDGPQEQRDRNLQGHEHEGVLPDTRADQATCGLEDDGCRLREKLAHPQTHPEDFDPDEQSQQRRVPSHVLAGKGGHQNERNGKHDGDGEDVESISRQHGGGVDLPQDVADLGESVLLAVVQGECLGGFIRHVLIEAAGGFPSSQYWSLRTVDRRDGDMADLLVVATFEIGHLLDDRDFVLRQGHGGAVCVRGQRGRGGEEENCWSPRNPGRNG
nr:hypothetical protein CFP56_32159 [Quercus suber]